MKILLATHNRKKLVELSRILTPLLPQAEVISLDAVEAYDEPAETEPTFAGNALLKARAAAAHAGLAAVGDDSGLCVDALNGMPGVLSARWAGRPTDDARNVSLLLDQLLDVPDERRGAAFVTSAAFVLPDGTERVADGRLDGRIIREPRGSGGFGYDPIFVPEGPEGVVGAEAAEQRTLAEMTEDKDEISHRGRALRALAPLIAAILSRK